MTTVPSIRIRNCNESPARRSADYVLYWMIASRRLHSNFALDRALEHCAALAKPLLIFEPLRVAYPWASDRLHRFVLDGMADNAVVCRSRGVRYYPYVEPAPGMGKGLLTALARNACVVVVDDFPCFFLPHMVAAGAKKLSVRLEAVDSNGLLPIRAADQAFLRAFDFRRFLQSKLPQHFCHFPHPDPLANVKLRSAPSLPRKITSRWPCATKTLLVGEPGSLDILPIDHSVKPTTLRGGHASARARMLEFFATKLSRYAEFRNHPDHDISSGFSPFLHFGHLSVHEIFSELARREKWKPAKLSLRCNGSREGWWNMSPAAETLLDQLVTWREVGFNFSSQRDDYDKFSSLPAWVQKTLHDHATDTRDPLYTLGQFEFARTHDPLWNAAQTQLLREGRIHNYLRMLWGKKILQWSRSPEDAADIMIHLNNKYALDGRDSNSYSGIFWVLGRYDRPWAPVRPIFGSIRYMSSENAVRKLSVKDYLRRYGPKVPAEKTL